MSLSSGDLLASEARRCGLKVITRMIHDIIKRERRCSYNLICSQLKLLNEKTTRRRIYDVLNIMKSLNIISKDRRMYFLVTKETPDLESVYGRKMAEIERVKGVRDVFRRLVERNAALGKCDWKYGSENLHLPFLVVSTDKDAEIHIETNEDRTFFNFRCSRELELIEDIEVVKRIFLRDGEDTKENAGTGGEGDLSVGEEKSCGSLKAEKENDQYNIPF